MDEIDKPFMPSRWCLREGMSPQEVISHHETITLKYSEENRKLLSHHKIHYREVEPLRVGEVSEQAFEWYPALPGSSRTPHLGDTVIVFIHGGYWQALDLQHSTYMAHTVCQVWGAHFAALGYTTAPGATLADMIHQVQMGMSKIIDYARERGISRFFVMGHSAGAHLAAALLMPSVGLSEEQRRYVTGLILISGVYNLVPLLPTSINHPLQLSASEAVKWSITTHLPNLCGECEKFHIRVFILVGSNDPPVFQQASLELFQYLKSSTTAWSSSKDLLYKIFPGYDHFHMVENLLHPEDALTSSVKSFVDDRD